MSIIFLVHDKLTSYCSKRISGFDMAPPASAMLDAGSGVAAAAAAAAAAANAAGIYAFTRF